MGNKLAGMAKAIVAAVIAGIGSLVAGGVDDGVKLSEGLIALGVVLTAFQAVYWVRNREDG